LPIPTFQSSNIDELVKSQKVRFPVIPAKAGIQLFQILKNSLDSGFHRSDDFLRDHQYSIIPVFQSSNVPSFSFLWLHVFSKNTLQLGELIDRINYGQQ
jgi:hypothetical protein